MSLRYYGAKAFSTLLKLNPQFDRCAAPGSCNPKHPRFFDCRFGASPLFPPAPFPRRRRIAPTLGPRPTTRAAGDYDAQMGRFISRDPLGEAGGMNLYAAFGNDPVNKWDYLGLCEIVGYFTEVRVTTAGNDENGNGVIDPDEIVSQDIEIELKPHYDCFNYSNGGSATVQSGPASSGSSGGDGISGGSGGSGSGGGGNPDGKASEEKDPCDELLGKYSESLPGRESYKTPANATIAGALEIALNPASNNQEFSFATYTNDNGFRYTPLHTDGRRSRVNPLGDPVAAALYRENRVVSFTHNHPLLGSSNHFSGINGDMEWAHAQFTPFNLLAPNLTLKQYDPSKNIDPFTLRRLGNPVDSYIENIPGAPTPEEFKIIEDCLKSK